MLATPMIRRLCLKGAAVALWLGFGHMLSPAVAQESDQVANQGSSAFERFRWSFFEDENWWRDGLDKSALLELEGDQRGRAEAMLLRHLPDDRGIIGLGELRSQRARPQLLRLFDAERQAQRKARRAPDSDWLPYRMLNLAKALWQIQPDPSSLAVVTDVLASADLDLQRMDAAIALAVFRDPGAVRALVQALDDPAKLVRHHAARSLLLIYGLQDEADIMEHGSEHMMYRVMSDDPVRHAGGKRDILAAIAGRPLAAQ